MIPTGGVPDPAEPDPAVPEHDELGDPDSPEGLGIPGLGELFQQAQLMQAQMAQAQDELVRTHVQGSSGGGLVTATVTGAGEVIDLTIDRAAVDLDDDEGMANLADLVVAAIRDANRVADELQATTMGPLTASFGPIAEGFGLSVGGAAGVDPDQPDQPELPGR